MGKVSKETGFDVIMGIDMETDVGSFTSTYEGVKKGTPRLLSIFRRHDIPATFFWTGHAAESNPAMVRRVRDCGHEIGGHSYMHETLGEALFDMPNSWPVLPEEVEGRIVRTTRAVIRAAGVRPVSFRCPRAWGSTQVVKILEKLGYCCDASLPMYYYRHQPLPYHPSAKDWTKRGNLKIVEIPNFCDLTMKSKDPLYHRDRDQWPIFRTKSAAALLKRVDSFVGYVRRLKRRPVVCFYFHPWEFCEMPSVIHFAEGVVRPKAFITKNCGPKALEQFELLCRGLLKRGAKFRTARDVAKDY